MDDLFDRETGEVVIKQDVFNFLDDLRESGVTNMFGSGPYIRKQFGVSRKEAQSLFIEWTEQF